MDLIVTNETLKGTFFNSACKGLVFIPMGM